MSLKRCWRLTNGLMASIASSDCDPAYAGPRGGIAPGGREATPGQGPLLTLDRFDPRLELIASHLCGRGVAAYVFGGAVRDALLGRATRDLDVTVSDPADRIGRELADLLGGTYFQLDPVRGIGRVTVAGPGAITVDLTGGLPAAEIDRHLRSRDFTIDAMAVCLRELTLGPGAVLDPVGGLLDLRSGLVRALSPSALDDDPIRLLRGPRLAAARGLTLDPSTAGWIRERAGLIARVAPERVRDELLKLLAAPAVTQSLRRLDDLRLLTAVIPELEQGRGVGQPPEHHYDVLDHCIETPGALELILDRPGDGTVASCIPRFQGMREYFGRQLADGADRATILRLTCLLHDVAKAATRTVEPSGRIRFLGHGPRGAAVCRNLMERLRFSRRSIRFVTTAVEHHLRPGQAAPPGELPSAKAIYRYRRDLEDLAVDVLYLNMADYIAAKGPPMLEPGYDLADWERHCGVVTALLEGDDGQGPEARSSAALLDGNDIMAELSLEPGPMVGELLEMVEEARATGQIGSRTDALDLARSALESRRRCLNRLPR